MKMKLRTGAALLLALSVTVGLAEMVRQQLDYDRGAADYREARQLAGLAEAEPASVSALPEESALRQTLQEIDLPALQQINPDVIGWILIPGTGISYPLMQTEDNEYYLKHTWKREKNSTGAIFLDYRNSASFSDFNSLIYGHRMRNGSMFGSLHNYKETAFWQTSPGIYIINADGIYRYDIFAAYEAAGIRPYLSKTLGGCDASNIALHDIAVVNIGTGMRDVHTTAENISIKDMEDSTRFLCELLKA